jgi:hypothetical protein
MKSFSAGFIFLSIAFNSFSQLDTEKIADSIVKEGKKLYRLEMANWHGTDIFLEKFSEQRSKVGGYFSYAYGKQTFCTFFSRDESPKVLATFSFDSTFNTTTAKVESVQRDFTVQEKEIYTLRQLSKDLIYKDSLFKTYQNSSLNIIPVVEPGIKKVYVLTGPQADDIVFIGNDYLVNFDHQNNITRKRVLHNNVLSISHKPGDKIDKTYHTHVRQTGDFITATDICTLMLYQHLTKWKMHYVVGDNYVSIWDCEKYQLTILTREVWDKMGQNN